MSGVNHIKPSVHIHEAGAARTHLSEICAGLEEEGIPYTIVKSSGGDKALALEAANHSQLRVGIGITRDSATLQMQSSPDFATLLTQHEKHTESNGKSPDAELLFTQHPDSPNPILYIDLSTPKALPQCRALGTNAARAVKSGIFI